MNTTNHTSPSGEDAANGAIGEREHPAWEHELKTDPEVFAAVLDGSKTHEIRFNDRDFKIGDTLLLRETRYTGQEMRGPEPRPLEYTGRETTRVVSHVLEGYGLKPGWVILSFARAALTAEKVAAEPVAYDMTYTNGNRSLVYPKELAHIEKARIVTGYVAAPLYTAPQPAQTQVALTDIDQYRMQMAGICTAALGHWKEGDDLHPDYDTPALHDVAALYAKYEENRALLAAQPVSGGKS